MRPDRDDGDAGYASVAAIAVCLALAMVAAGLVAKTTTDLRAAQSGFQRASAQTLLDGGHTLAGLRLAAGTQVARLGWTIDLDRAALQVLAEPEASKAKLAEASKFEPQSLERLGARSGVVAADKLAEPSKAAWGSIRKVIAADKAPMWQACAPSAISAYGTQAQPVLEKVQAPEAGSGVAPSGQVWRIQITEPGGYIDDRLVRLTGDPKRPTAVIERRFYRAGREEISCPIVRAEP